MSGGARLGSDDGRLTLDGARAINEAIERMFLACRRQILVRAPRLDPDFYFTESFTESCQAIVVRERRNELRFLVEDERFVMQVNSRLLALARRFSSYVGLRVVPPEYLDRQEMFVVRDRTAWLHQPGMQQQRALMSGSERGQAQQLERRFRELWERSAPPSELHVTGL